MAAYYVSHGDMALAAAARLYIYGRGHMSKATFDDPEFRAMNQACYVAGGGRGKAPVLTTQGLQAWVDADDSFVRFVFDSNSGHRTNFCSCSIRLVGRVVVRFVFGSNCKTKRKAGAGVFPSKFGQDQRNPAV